MGVKPRAGERLAVGDGGLEGEIGGLLSVRQEARTLQRRKRATLVGR